MDVLSRPPSLWEKGTRFVKALLPVESGDNCPRSPISVVLLNEVSLKNKTDISRRPNDLSHAQQ